MSKLFLGLVLLWSPSTGFGAPITLQLTIDELFRGRATLTGDLDDTVFNIAVPGFEGFAVKNVQSVGTVAGGNNWKFDVEIVRSTVLNPAYSIRVEAQHLTLAAGSFPGPSCCLHDGESSPGLIIREHPTALGAEHTNITGAASAGTSGLPNVFTAITHPGSSELHDDILLSHIDDLNGAAIGFATAGNQISLQFDTVHTPEPSTLLLSGVGMLLFALRRVLR